MRGGAGRGRTELGLQQERQELPGWTGQGGGGALACTRTSRCSHLHVYTSVRSLHVLHLTKQHQWNLQLHCQTLVYWCVL